MAVLEAPVTTADLHILFVRDEGSQVVIGPRMGAGGFRQADLLRELKFVQIWLENRKGVERVLIDIAENEYLRGRTVAGLVMLHDHVPDGAEFAVCGESQLLEAVLAKMQARESVPVFENTESAFVPQSRWPVRTWIRKVPAAISARRTVLLRISGGLLATALLTALVMLLKSTPEREYDRLLSTWEQLQVLRRDKPGSPDLSEFQQSARQSIAELASDYRTIPQRTPQQELFLSAADALYDNLGSTGDDVESEQAFVQKMEAIAAELEIDELPSRSKYRRPQRQTLLE